MDEEKERRTPTWWMQRRRKRSTVRESLATLSGAHGLAWGSWRGQEGALQHRYSIVIKGIVGRNTNWGKKSGWMRTLPDWRQPCAAACNGLGTALPPPSFFVKVNSA